MSDRVFNVLFLCTGNSARSLLAEVQLNVLGRGRFKAFSAGSHPTGAVNPFTIEFLTRAGMPADGLRSKSWDEFAARDAPVMDFVLTVCDQAAGEMCPIWPGQPMSARWGVPDPTAVDGSDEDKRHAFKDAATTLRKRIELFISLPIATLDRMSLQARLNEIGTSTGSPPPPRSPIRR